ncbi:hypothetical protein [Haloarcula nitratireducens]|uniref:Uncharacterized protein n=1 Tax=Haloarcula nitratireducens TaxID=2487749 RepID=A0AAW4PEB7_9EURY|nr:hypothetical protein [Halomicroarcula nitratireducens]MBX0296183.1 hypothetical protein [Halomicroarcula nitratireducens]
MDANAQAIAANALSVPEETIVEACDDPPTVDVPLAKPLREIPVTSW